MDSSITYKLTLTGGQGAALLTGCEIYREEARRTGKFQGYAKRHHASWVDFAREAGYGDVDPVLVTGVGRTKDFAVLSYSNPTGGVSECSFITTPTSGGASVWGTWIKPGSVHAACGPHPRRPSTQNMGLTSSGDNRTEIEHDEYKQCVFVKYITIQNKRSWVPKFKLKARAGPHDPGTGGRDGGGSPIVPQSDSGSSSDDNSAPRFLSSDGDDHGSTDTDTSIGSDSDILIHVPDIVRHLPRLLSVPIFADSSLQEERHGFHPIVDYIFK
jgi:hypothetical protein